MIIINLAKSGISFFIDCIFQNSFKSLVSTFSNPLFENVAYCDSNFSPNSFIRFGLSLQRPLAK